MNEFVELITTFPAVVFTTLLLFCIAWLLVTTVIGFGGHHHGHHDVGGHGGHGGAHDVAHHGQVDHSGHGHGHGHDQHGHDGHGHGHQESPIAALPPAISLSMISFGGWIVSVIATAAMDAADMDGPVRWIAGSCALVAGSYAGLTLTTPLAKAMAPLFVTQLAPSEDSVVGSYARVQSPELDDDDLGQPGRVVITQGPLKSAAFRAKAVPGRRFPMGATVFVVDADRIDGRLVVYCDEPELTP